MTPIAVRERLQRLEARLADVRKVVEEVEGSPEPRSYQHAFEAIKNIVRYEPAR